MRQVAKNYHKQQGQKFLDFFLRVDSSATTWKTLSLTFHEIFQITQSLTQFTKFRNLQLENYRSSTEEGSDRYSKCSCQFILFGIDVIWHNMLYRSAHQSKCGQVKEHDLFRKLFQNRFPLVSYFLIVFYCSVLFIPNDLASLIHCFIFIYEAYTHLRTTSKEILNIIRN